MPEPLDVEGNPDETPAPDVTPGINDISTPVIDEPGATPAGDPPPGDETDWKKRHGDAVRYAQEEKGKKEALESRIAKIEDAGFNLDEIEGLIGTPKPAADKKTSGDYVSKDEFNNAVAQAQYNMAKTAFAGEHPEYKDSEIMGLLEDAARKVVSEEIRTTGRVTSDPDAVLKEASKAVNKVINRFREEGKDSALIKKKALGKAGIVEAGTEGPSKPSGDEKPEDTRSDYIKAHEAHQERMKKPSLA